MKVSCTLKNSAFAIAYYKSVCWKARSRILLNWSNLTFTKIKMSSNSSLLSPKKVSHLHAFHPCVLLELRTLWLINVPLIIEEVCGFSSRLFKCLKPVSVAKTYIVLRLNTCVPLCLKQLKSIKTYLKRKSRKKTMVVYIYLPAITQDKYLDQRERTLGVWA